MAVPTYDKFIEPIIRYLESHPKGAIARDVHEAAAASLGLSEEDKSEFVPSGSQPLYKNRAGWAHDRLKRNGFSTSLKRGYWQLTQAGMEFAKKNPSPFPEELVDRLASVNLTIRLSPQSDDSQLAKEPDAQPKSSTQSTPDERLADAIREIRETVAIELMEALSKVTPTFFERTVLEVLHRMGYGADRADIQRLGGSGDAGIDGVISLDKLGLEKVYVQAKRWHQQSVGRPDIQAFYGALAGQRARKGVFITTSTFTAQAVEFARSVEGIVLVDGPRLAQLMIDHEVGVSLRSVHLPKLDSDYFESD